VARAERRRMVAGAAAVARAAEAEGTDSHETESRVCRRLGGMGAGSDMVAHMTRAVCAMAARDRARVRVRARGEAPGSAAETSQAGDSGGGEGECGGGASEGARGDDKGEGEVLANGSGAATSQAADGEGASAVAETSQAGGDGGEAIGSVAETSQVRDSGSVDMREGVVGERGGDESEDEHVGDMPSRDDAAAMEGGGKSKQGRKRGKQKGHGERLRQQQQRRAAAAQNDGGDVGKAGADREVGGTAALE